LEIKRTPAVVRTILHQDKEGEELQTVWEYRSMIGQKHFLEKSTRPDIAYAVHQCGRIGRYLMATRSEGLILEPTNS